MNGTRFARSGRCRFFMSLGALVIMFLMIAIFHSSQQQLDESREQRIRCEQQQDSLNIRLQAIVEQKYNIEKTLERERKEQMEKNKNLELSLKQQKEQMLRDKTESMTRSEKLSQSLKHLQTEHSQLVGECSKNNRKHTEELNVAQKKLELANSELQKERSTNNDSASQWKEKMGIAQREKEEFETLNKQLKERITLLENIVNEYKSKCDYKIKGGEIDLQQQIIKPASSVSGPSSSDRPAAFHKPQNIKSFIEQESVSPDLYRIKIIPKTIPKKLPDEAEAEAEKIKRKSGGGGVSQPLVVPTPEHSKNNLNLPDVAAKLNSTVANVAASVSAPSVNQRQLPDNVAPIPENFEDLQKNEPPVDKEVELKNVKSAGFVGADIDAAVEDLQKNDNNNNNNIAHYGDLENDLEQKMKLGVAAANEDSGAHEIKDINERNSNIKRKVNFFDNPGKNDDAGETFNKHYDDNDDDDMLGGAIVGGGGVAVGGGDHNESKNRNNLLEAEGLNNEVLRDQGKEFPDGIHIEDGNEEDEDEDDYSNPALRNKGAHAIRN